VEDIPALAKHFVERSARRMNMVTPKLTRAHVELLTAYAWPGNVRELENVVERAMILTRSGKPLQFDLPAKSTGRTTAAPKEPEATAKVRTRGELREEERRNILAALKAAGGKVFGRGGAADLLGMRPTTLASRLRAMGLQKKYVASDEGPSER